MAKVLGFTIEINGTQRAISTSEELRRAIADVGKELKKATDVDTIQKLEKELIQLKARQNEVNKETRESIKLQQQQLTAVDNASGAYDRLSKELNEARKRYKDLAAAEQDSTDEAQQLIKRIVELDGKLKGVDASVGQFQRNVGNYAGAIGQFFPQIGGIFDNVSNSIANIGAQTSKVGKAAGIAGAAFAIFGAVSSVIDELNQSLEETRAISAQIQNFTGATGDALNKNIAQAKAVAETYKADVNDVLVAANSFSKNLGVDFTQALNLIEVGFRKGANAQGEFLDGLREYPVQFRDAGASAEQFIKISIAAAKEGIYSDKGLDAVKEFGLRIREQTKATGDALNNALGSKFTKQLFSDLNTGAITSVDALGRVTTALKENGVQGAQLQTVIADVFGGPGEDVGQAFLFTLGEIIVSTDDVTQSSNAYQRQLNELYQANLELNEAQSGYNQALSDVSFEFQVAQTKAKAFFASILAGAFEFANQLPATLKSAGAAIKAFFTTGAITDAGAAYNKTFKQEIRKIKDDDEIQKSLLAQANKVDKPVQNKFRSVGKAAGESFVSGSVAALEKEKSKLEKSFEDAVAGSDTQALIAVNLKKVEQQLEDAVAKQNKILFEGERKALAAQLGDISALATIALPKDIESISGASANAISDLNKLAQSSSKSIKQTGDDVKITYEDILKSAGMAFSGALDVIGQFQAAKAEKEQEAFAQQIEQIDANITALEEKQQTVGRIRAKQIQREIDAAKQQRAAAEQQAEEAQKKAAKKQKVLSIIQATIQGAVAVVGALSAPPFFPLNLASVITTGVLAAAQIAAIAAQPLATGGVVGISGRRVTDGQNMPTRSNGDNVLATVKRGEVVLNQQQQSALGGAGTFRSIGVPGFSGGGIVPPITAPAVAAASSGGDLFAALDRKTDAINQRIDRIQAYVVSEEIRSDLAEGDKLKIEATL